MAAGAQGADELTAKEAELLKKGAQADAAVEQPKAAKVMLFDRVFPRAR